MSRGERWAGLATVAALVLLTGAGAVLAPERLLALAAKEGPAEAVGHVVLLAAALAWALVRRHEGRGALLIAAACLVVLGEELDWGALFGWSLATARAGPHNLHNAMGGASYLLFALPWVWLYAASLGIVRGPRWVPPRLDGVAFGLVVTVALGSLVTSSAWERALDELSELMLYALLCVGGLRPSRPK